MPERTTPRTWANDDFMLASLLNTHLVDASMFLKSRPFGNTVMTSTVNTTSTSFTELTGSRVTLTTTGGNILIAVCGIFSNSTTGTENYFDLAIDGTRYGDATVGLTQITCPNNNYPDCLSMILFTSTPPSAASHTFSMYWKVSANTGTTLVRLFVLEIR